MALKAVLDNLDDVPEALHDEYTKKTVNGKEVYILNVEDLDSHPSVRNLKNAHEAVKKKRDELKEELETTTARFEGLPEDFNADAYKTLKAAAEGKGGQLSEEQIKEIRADERKKVTKELEPKVQRAERLDAEVRRRTIEGGLTQALLDAGVSKEFLPAVRAMLKERGKIDLIDEDGQFDARVETNLGPQSIAEFVMDWAASPEGKAFMGKPSGGDAGGNNGKSKDENPFVVAQGGKINLTKVQNLVKENPEKARQLARAAGLPDAQLRQYGLSA